MKLQLTIETWSDKEDSRLRLEGFDDTAGFDKRVFLAYHTIENDFYTEARDLVKEHFPNVELSAIKGLIEKTNLLEHKPFNQDKFLYCDLWELSNCCNSSFLYESDICRECREHASPVCADCEDYDICTNDNKI